MLLNQVYVLIIVDSLLFLAHAVRHDYFDEKDSNIYGVQESCDITTHPYFVVLYNHREACGGALVSLRLAVVGSLCIDGRLGGKKGKKWVRAGINPRFQHRRVIKTRMCYRKVDCNFAIVEVKSKFILSEAVNVARAATYRSIIKCEEGTYLYTTYKRPWFRKRALNLYCVKIGLTECVDSDDICADKEGEEDQNQDQSIGEDYDDYYHQEGDDDNGGPEIVTKKDYDETTDGNGGNKNKDDKIYIDDEDDDDENADEDKGICNNNSGGPLMCGPCVLGFLLGSSCQRKRKGDEGVPQFRFSNMRKQTDELIQLLGGSARALLRNGTKEAEKSGGRSLLKINDFQTKFLSVALTAALFIFVY